MINIKNLLQDIPKPIRLFLGKALLLFVVWKILYVGFLLDSKILDYPLTTHVGEASAELLNRFSSMSGFESVREVKTSIYEGELITEETSMIYHNNKPVLYIADVCNGLELIVLYIGFIVCMPSSFFRKLLYIVLGAILLDVVNIGRCIGLIYLREYFEYYFDFAHKYLFKITIYAFTFLLWMLYARKINLNNESVQVE
ncbi:archaeosortase/exosortase family protein [Winogradskyella sp.]|uniref:archaeosortase/exosortase family protein n=1 Tax=Winogradskyella sp. TaxID=1883156 RepID=UPI001B2CF99A|nr:archaeosortase/exosortase family protein [Winogradskyella sp.]MBO6880789.1 archaeosortase/exosortase family protein [Winogradskyella sp.]